MVADDSEKRNVGVSERAEDGECTHDVGQRRPPVVKEVAGVDDSIDVVGDGILDDALEGREKVLASLGPMVLLIPKVSVPSVYHPCHVPQVVHRPVYAFSPRGESKTRARPLTR